MYKVLRIKYVLVFLCLYLILNTQYLIPVSAHLFGQPPFFRINGQYSQLYFVPLSSVADFALPQDGAPSNYLVNQSIQFDFDINRLPAPPDVVKKTKFTWDFADGTKGEGLAITHTYKKMGTYILVVYADDGTTPAPQVIESVVLNVLPTSDYKLPQAVVTVNGKNGTKTPLVDIMPVDFSKPITFDASSSTDSTGTITSYFWDFGDQKSSTQKSTTHSYAPDSPQTYPLLRITDSNGFFSDQFVEIQSYKKTGGLPLTQSSSTSPRNSKTQSQLPIVLGIIAVLTAAGFMARRLTRGRYRGKRR